jgi:hypothetical protein
MMIRGVLIVCLLGALFVSAQPPRAPRQLRMFTVVAPYQATQAAMWHFRAVKRLPSAIAAASVANNGLKVAFAYDADGPSFNGIQNWRNAVYNNIGALSGSPNCFQGVKAAALAAGPNPNLALPKLAGAACKAPALAKVRARGKANLLACFGKLRALTNPPSGLAVYAAPSWQLTGLHPSCAIACMLAIATSNAAATPSCSIALETGPTAHLQGYMDFSGPAVPLSASCTHERSQPNVRRRWRQRRCGTRRARRKL